jgi:ABC-type transporter Mla subunit MlaD
MIIQVVTIFFILLILVSFVRALTKPKLIEGAVGTYQVYAEDPLILAKKNAANIEVLKQSIDEISGITQQVKTNTGAIDKNTKTIKSLLSSMSPVSNDDSKKNQALVDEDPKTFNM